MTLLLTLFVASTSFLVLSGIAAFAMVAWQRRQPPRATVVDGGHPDDDGPGPDPGPDDPDPRLDVWAEFERLREPVAV